MKQNIMRPVYIPGANVFHELSCFSTTLSSGHYYYTSFAEKKIIVRFIQVVKWQNGDLTQVIDLQTLHLERQCCISSHIAAKSW